MKSTIVGVLAVLVLSSCNGAPEAQSISSVQSVQKVQGPTSSIFATVSTTTVLQRVIRSSAVNNSLPRTTQPTVTFVPSVVADTQDIENGRSGTVTTESSLPPPAESTSSTTVPPVTSTTAIDTQEETTEVPAVTLPGRGEHPQCTNPTYGPGCTPPVEISLPPSTTVLNHRPFDKPFVPCDPSWYHYPSVMPESCNQ